MGTPKRTLGTHKGPQNGRRNPPGDPRSDMGTPKRTLGTHRGPQRGPRDPQEGHRDVPTDLAGAGVLGDGDAEGVRGGRDVVPPRPAGL